MNARKRHIAEINRLETILQDDSISSYLRNDYTKALERLKRELKEYDRYRAIIPGGR